MGGACSRKTDQQEDEEVVQRAVSGRYSKSGSSKWLATSFSRPAGNTKHADGKCPSLMDLCVEKINKVVLIFHFSYLLSIQTLYSIFIFVLHYRTSNFIKTSQCCQGI